MDQFYKFKNEYWHYSAGGLFGPFESLAEAMHKFGITDAVESIHCTELTAAEFAKRVDVHDALPGDRVEINCDEWEVSPDGKLERAADRKNT